MGAAGAWRHMDLPKEEALFQATHAKSLTGRSPPLYLLCSEETVSACAPLLFC